MLIGGFYSVDGRLLCDTVMRGELPLRLDLDGSYGNKIYTNNGRTASVYAMAHCGERMKGKKVLLPDYLCLSVISAVEWSGVPYDFYRVKKNLEIDMEDLIKKIDDSVGMIYVIHYFSVPQPRWMVNRLKAIARKRNLLIMEDITQALFSAEEGRMGFGDYIVGSTRKWFPMTDGGVLAIKDGLGGNELCMKDGYDESVYKELLISVLRLQYQNHPELDIQPYLDSEKAANAARYVDLTPRKMTDASKKVLMTADLEHLIRRRIANFKYLYERLEKNENIEILSRRIDDNGHFVPFGLTILVEDRDGLYRYLTRNRVIPEIQWILPREYYSPGDDAVWLSEHNLMLQCDQRYGISEMEYVAGMIEAYFKA